MKVNILERNDKKLRFVLKGIDLAVANALRRVMISTVPSIAIEDVIILDNSSPMKDEILAHRLGLIPLKTDLESYIFREKCDCHSELGCSKCCVILTLEAEAIDSPRTVYSKELKSNDPYIIPISGEIPILKLAPNQKIHLEGYAWLGQGSEHAKWQPVSVCTLRPLFNITIDLEKCNACKKCIDACYKQILRIEDDKIEILEHEMCDGCKQCEESCPNKAVKVKNSKDTLVFNIESTGVLPPERIFDKAVEILKTKAQEFISHISNLKLEEESDEKARQP